MDWKDNGYKSRKLTMSYVVMALGTLGYLAVGKWPALAVAYPEFCVFLIGTSGIYVGGNAAVKWVAARNGSRTTPEESSGK
jgi:hypothetical protein